MYSLLHCAMWTRRRAGVVWGRFAGANASDGGWVSATVTPRGNGHDVMLLVGDTAAPSPASTDAPATTGTGSPTDRTAAGGPPPSKGSSGGGLSSGAVAGIVAAGVVAAAVIVAAAYVSRSRHSGYRSVHQGKEFAIAGDAAEAPADGQALEYHSATGAQQVQQAY